MRKKKPSKEEVLKESLDRIKTASPEDLVIMGDELLNRALCGSLSWEQDISLSSQAQALYTRAIFMKMESGQG